MNNEPLDDIGRSRVDGDEERPSEADTLRPHHAAEHQDDVEREAQRVATELNNRAARLCNEGEPANAEPLLREAIEILRAANCASHLMMATCLNNLAELYRKRGEYAVAEEHYWEALDIYSARVQGGQSDSLKLRQGFVTTGSNLGLLYREQGNYDKSEQVLQIAVGTCRDTIEKLGANVPSDLSRTFSTVLSNLGDVVRDRSDYHRAHQLFSEALKTRIHALGESDGDVALSMISMAVLAQETGDLGPARYFLERALTISISSLGERDLRVAECLNNLANLDRGQGDYATALRRQQEALEIIRTTLGEAHPWVATCISNLAEVYSARGDYDAAEVLHRENLEVMRRSLGESHPHFGRAVNNLALLHANGGDYAAAAPLYRQALETYHAALGNEHPEISRTLFNLALTSAATGQWIEAMSLMEQASAIDDRMTGQVFSLGSDRQRMAYLSQSLGHLNAVLSLIARMQPPSPTFLRSALDILLRRKAIGLEALSVQRTAILEIHYASLHPRLRELAMIRLQAATKRLAGPSSNDLEGHQRELFELDVRREVIESELTRQIPEMNLGRQLETVNYLTVARKLPAGSALVEFVRFEALNFGAVLSKGDARWGPARYLAFVLLAGDDARAAVVELGEAATIDRLIADFRTAVTGRPEIRAPLGRNGPTPDFGREGGSPQQSLRRAILSPTRNLGTEADWREDRDLSEAGDQLRARVFDPLIPVLGGRTRLFVAPDGDLARVPFEILPLDQAERLIDRYKFSYLTVGRDVVRFGQPLSAQPGPPLVLADPDFNRGLCAERRGWVGPFARLFGTQAEGRGVAGLLGVPPVMGGDVLRGRLRSCRSPWILHLATHGMFLSEVGAGVPKADSPALGTSAVSRIDRMSRLENPLLRSFLALAGANTWVHTGLLADEAENGILTAEDVAEMDLLSTELVVLSACETGLGDVRAGEGVFGLRRAFVLAGAKTLVMSLWKVPDQETQELVEDFYRRMLAGRPRADALREAQLAMRERHPEPLYWGAFICQGDPGPLLPDPFPTTARG